MLLIDTLKIPTIDTSIVISILALLFTIGSFWWMNWRYGKLHIGKPRTFAGFGSLEGKMVLTFPFIFFNDGPMPIFIRNLRIVLSEENPTKPLTFVATVKKLGTDEDRSFSTQFPIRGRESILMICEFQREPGGFLFEKKSYPIEIQALIGESKKWKCISKFNIELTDKNISRINEMFSVHEMKM